MNLVNPFSGSWLLQVSSGWGQSSPQETGAAGHGPTPETLAVQTPRQPVSHQDGEGAAGSGFTHDTRTGEMSSRKTKDLRQLSVEAVSCNKVRLCRFPTGLQMPGEGSRTQWDSQTWAGPWGSNSIINTSRETLNGWACAVTTPTQRVRAGDLKLVPREQAGWFVTSHISRMLCFLCCRWRVSLTNSHQPVKLRQVVLPQERAGETGQRPRHGGLGQQWRQHVAPIQIQERLTEPVSERHPAAHDGSEGRWRHLFPKEEESLRVVQLQRLWSRCRVSGVVLWDWDKLCLPHGWERNNCFNPAVEIDLHSICVKTYISITVCVTSYYDNPALSCIIVNYTPD